MSIFFTVMKGQWDGILSWPFVNSLTFTLLDQSETDMVHDVTATFTPRADENTATFLGRPEKLRNPSLGNSNRMYLDDTQKYLNAVNNGGATGHDNRTSCFRATEICTIDDSVD